MAMSAPSIAASTATNPAHGSASNAWPVAAPSSDEPM